MLSPDIEQKSISACGGFGVVLDQASKEIQFVLEIIIQAHEPDLVAAEHGIFSRNVFERVSHFANPVAL